MRSVICTPRCVDCRLLAALLILVTLCSTGIAQNGTWTNAGGGDYNTTTNWAGNTVASGAGNTANFNTVDITSDVSVTLNQPLTIGNMIFGDTNLASGGSWAVTTTSLPTAIITLDNGGTKPTLTVNQLTPATFDDAFIGNSIAGTMGFNKAGAGILTLGPGTGNTITGGININEGTLRVQAAIPTQQFTMANGTTMQSAAAVNGLAIASGGTATYTLTGANNTLSNVTSTGGTLNLNIATNNVTLSAGGAWTGLANLNVTGQNATGVSFLRVMPNPTGGPPAFDTTVFANTNVHLDNAQLLIRTNSFGNTMPIGRLTGTSTGVLAGGNSGTAARYELGGLNNSYTYEGQINGAGGISINKVGTGTITLAGNIVGGGNGSMAINGTPARQGGVFRVTQGTLAVTGVSSIPGGPAANPTILTTIDVLPGAIFDVSGAPSTFTTSTQQKIQGGGTVLGNYNHAAGLIQPGDVGAPTDANEGNLSSGVTPTAGTLTFNGNLQLSGGGIVYDMTLNPASGNDRIQVTGSTALNGGKITPNFLQGIPTSGTYTILTSTGGFSGSASNLSVDMPGRTPDQPVQVSGTNLVFTPGAIVPPKSLTWTGTTNSNWDVETSQNWTDGVMNERFFQLDSVAFTQAATNKNVTVTTLVQPTETVTINNTTPYAFTGTGAIVGPVGLTKTGSGNLTMQVANTFTGPASISGGATVDIGTFGTALGAGELTLENVTILGSNTAASGLGNSAINSVAGSTNTIQIDGEATTSDPFNIPTLAGDGTVTITSTLADKWFPLNGMAEFTGTLNLTGVDGATPGHYRLTTAGGGGNLSGAVVNLSDARLSNRQGGAAGSTATFQIGELHGDANGRITSFEGGGTAIHAQWQIGALNTNSDYAGVIEDGAGTTSTVVKVGTGTLTLTGANTYTGATAVNSGTLSITNPTLSLADAADVLMNTGAILDLNFLGTDTIRSLYIDGVSQAVGTWGSLSSNATNKRSFFTGNGILNVSTFVPFVLIGDYDDNDIVDARDYVVYRNNIGAATLPNRDPANTGVIGPADLTAWQAHFGQVPPPGSGSALGGANVPEPSGLLLAMVGLALTSLRRGSRCAG